VIGWKPKSIGRLCVGRSAASLVESVVPVCSAGFLYNLVILAIIIAGVYFIGGRLHRVWEIREDMTQTLQQEQLLRDENTRLKAQYDKLNDPDEISREAREQFGLAKPDEIPYKP